MTTPPPAVEQYLLIVGNQCPPAVAERLRRIPWAQLTEGTVDVDDVHQLALLIAENLARRGKL